MHRRPRGILVGRVQGLGGLSWRGLPEHIPRAYSLRISPRAEPGRILFPAIPEVRVIRLRRGCGLRRGRAFKLAAGRQSRLKLREFDLISLEFSVCLSSSAFYSRPPFFPMLRDRLELKIFAGSAHKELARRICACVGVPLGDATVTSFPDGETYVKFNENIRGRDVFIVQPTCPPTNQNLMELLIMVDAARRASAARITAVIPFFGYARQDRKDQPRVPITAKLVANLLTAAGVSRVLTMDLHAQQVAGFFDIPVDHLYAAPVLIRHLREKSCEDLIVVSPDVGGLKMASAYSQALGTGLAIVAKRRKSPTEIEAMNVIGDVEGKVVLLVDDLTETAGTLTSAAKILKERGAGKIIAAVSHAVLSDLAIERLLVSQIEELITTNSVPVRSGEGFPITELCIAELLGEGIKRIHDDESVSSLFKISDNERF
jgi:ribose-phosphate pyrophosphokinase